MEFLKYEDVVEAINNGKGIEDLKVYNATYRPHMPIRIRDYGPKEPREREVGSDQHHDWLEIDSNGSLHYINMQACYGSYPEEIAKEFKECCFIPTYECPSEYGEEPEKYITPTRVLVIEEEVK